MAKFVIVKEAPKVLSKEEYVVRVPGFLEEVRANKGREPRGGLTAVNHLRGIVATIGAKYDPTLTAWTVTPVDYEGRPYTNDHELADIVREMLYTQHPQVFHAAIDYQIRQRPHGTKLIYFIGPLDLSTSFIRNGIDRIEEREIESYLSGKSSKKVKVAPENKDEDSGAA